MKVPQLDLIQQYNLINTEIAEVITKVLESGMVINGDNVENIEKLIAEYSGNRYGIGVANGSDAIFIALKALGIGKDDAVICPTFTFFATAGSIVRAEAVPVFIDINPYTYNIEPDKLKEFINVECKINRGTGELMHRSSGKIVKAIIPVHLYGQMCRMDEIMQIAGQYNLRVVEDCAQSIGAEYRGRRAGSYGDLGTFSFYPTKNLSTYGDGGLITTNKKELADYCKMFRAHGSKPKYFHHIVGINSRLDELHAAILTIKFKYLDEWLGKRYKAAQKYRQLFEKYELTDKVRLPITEVSKLNNFREHTFHQYVIFVEERDNLQEYLTKMDIGTNVYYPLCLHLQECFKYLGYKENDFPVSEMASKHALAIPMFPELAEIQQEYVVEKIKHFYN